MHGLMLMTDRLDGGCPDGVCCDYAHSPEELQEWTERRDFLRQKLAKARDDMLIMPDDFDFGKYNFLLQDWFSFWLWAIFVTAKLVYQSIRSLKLKTKLSRWCDETINLSSLPKGQLKTEKYAFTLRFASLEFHITVTLNLKIFKFPLAQICYNISTNYSLLWT